MALLSSVVRSSTVPTCFDQLVVGMPMYSDDCLEATADPNPSPAPTTQGSWPSLRVQEVVGSHG